MGGFVLGGAVLCAAGWLCPLVPVPPPQLPQPKMSQLWLRVSRLKLEGSLTWKVSEATSETAKTPVVFPRWWKSPRPQLHNRLTRKECDLPRFLPETPCGLPSTARGLQDNRKSTGGTRNAARAVRGLGIKFPEITA